ncbi:MAG: DsbA family protein [Asticcacaulis sp.]
MSEPETPTTERVTPRPAHPLWDVFSQANITTGLAVLAVVLAAAPYVVPKISTYLVEKGLMNKPALLYAANDAYQAQKAKEAAVTATQQIKAHHDAIFNDPSDPVIGAGPIKVVEFLDYQCAYCRAATPQVKAFLAANPDVQLVVKEYPVVHPENSIALAALGIEAFKAGHYEAVHYGFLDHNFHPEISGNIEGEVSDIVGKAGLDPAALKASMNDPAIKQQINRTIDLGGELGIDGTPTFVIGDTMVNGANMAGLQAAVAAQRANANRK